MIRKSDSSQLAATSLRADEQLQIYQSVIGFIWAETLGAAHARHYRHWITLTFLEHYMTSIAVVEKHSEKQF
jgi:hypothetical protein